VRTVRVPLLQHILALLAEMDLRYQQRFDAQGQTLTAALLAAEKAVQTALIAAEKAVAKAETANEKRFESVNEFRKTLSDQTASFPSRVELQALADRVSDLATRMDKTEGKSTGLTAGWGYLVGAVLLAGAVVGLIVAVTQ
jgi:hypothetical protein